ncbi:MAG: hypothetical protein VXW22_10310 [Pseudomonadota bacterium]|nr:hypothetical protein [Pseudomonadota bacterium]
MVRLDKTANVWGDITIVKQQMPYMYWDAKGCGALLNDLRAYRRVKNSQSGLVENKPFHGPESDSCDSVRYFVIAKFLGYLADYLYDETFEGHTFGTVSRATAGHIPGAYMAEPEHDEFEYAGSHSGGFGEVA